MRKAFQNCLTVTALVSGIFNGVSFELQALRVVWLSKTKSRKASCILCDLSAASQANSVLRGLVCVAAEAFVIRAKIEEQQSQCERQRKSGMPKFTRLRCFPIKSPLETLRRHREAHHTALPILKYALPRLDATVDITTTCF